MSLAKAPTPEAGLSRTTLLQMLAAELKISPRYLTTDVAITDLGLDSIKMAELVVAIEERTGRAVDTRVFSGAVHPEMKLDQFLDLLLSLLQGEPEDDG